MSMDELLTRMIDAEKEADRIVSDAKNAANELLAAARKDVAEREATAKDTDAKAADAAVAEAVANAAAERERRLKEANEEQERRVAAFRERLKSKKRLVVEGLMGHLQGT